MRVVFRADASLDIGTGHVMRCLTLADALRERGAECRFICRAHTGHLIAQVKARGYGVLELPYAMPTADPGGVAHAAWLGGTPEQDAEACAAWLDAWSPDWLVVDHYALDARWSARLRRPGRRILVIDDLIDRDHDCDLLLDQTFGRQAEAYVARVPAGCVCLCGAQYALLRPQFSEHRPASLARRGPSVPRTLLVSLGGIDNANVTGRVLALLDDVVWPVPMAIHVVMGGHAPWLDSVRRQVADNPRVHVHVDVNNMAQLMSASDLAIGAAGATSWERCCLGLPTLMAVLADNQVHVAEALAHQGAVRLLNMDQADLGLGPLLSSLLDDPALLAHMSHSARSVTDGQGVAAVAARLSSFG